MSYSCWQALDTVLLYRWERPQGTVAREESLRKPQEALTLLPTQDASQPSDCLITQRGYTSGQTVFSGTLDSQSMWGEKISWPNNHYSHLSLGVVNRHMGSLKPLSFNVLGLPWWLRQ